ncbi:MAG: hypothetical protein VW127_05255 [Flavobacteriaceae bacterium]|jgi:uncharacterized protein (TIGR02145 family)
MRSNLYLLFFGCLSLLTAQTRDASAILQLNSTTQGFLPPRMTTAQINAISNPTEGLMVYNTVSNSLALFNETNWVVVNTTFNPAVATNIQTSYGGGLVSYNYDVSGGANENKSSTVVNFYSSNENGGNRNLIDTTDGVPTAWTLDDYAPFTPTNGHLMIGVQTEGQYEVFSDPLSVVVIHDNLVYGTITSPLSGEIWLDRNMGATKAAPSSFSDTGDNNGNGLYYNHTDALNACPSGFRLPTDAEWSAEFAQGIPHTTAASDANTTYFIDHFMKFVPLGRNISATNSPYTNADRFQGNYAFFHKQDGVGYLRLGFNGADTQFEAGMGFTNSPSVRCIKDD